MDALWSGIDPDELVAAWAEELADLDRSELVAGLSAIVRSGSPFPPTLPEFYAACRPKIEVPPTNDHAGLDALARSLRVSTAGCASYHALRMRIIERANGARSTVPDQQPRLTQ